MIYFVTQEYLKRFTPINGNVDAEITGPLIEYSAKAFIKRQIGSYFFDDLFDKYNSKTLSAEETALVERMQLAIAKKFCF